MKKLSETYKELGIAFSFPIRIKDAKGNETYREDSKGYKKGTPRSAKNCDGKVVVFDGTKYKLKAL